MNTDIPAGIRVWPMYRRILVPLEPENSWELDIQPKTLTQSLSSIILRTPPASWWQVFKRANIVESVTFYLLPTPIFLRGEYVVGAFIEIPPKF